MTKPVIWVLHPGKTQTNMASTKSDKSLRCALNRSVISEDSDQTGSYTVRRHCRFKKIFLRRTSVNYVVN